MLNAWPLRGISSHSFLPGLAAARRHSGHLVRARENFSLRGTKRLRALAAAGVDLTSSGWITDSAPILDLALDIAD
jgi:hypothetical protein